MSKSQQDFDKNGCCIHDGMYPVEKYELCWKSIQNSTPPENDVAYFVSGHEWLGIAVWENEKGWTKGFIGEFPYDQPWEWDSDDLNMQVLYWAELPDYPIYGKTRLWVKE